MSVLDFLTRNSELHYYQVTLPEELTSKETAEWFTSISGALRASMLAPLVYPPTIVYEVHASKTGFIHSIRIPWTRAETILSQLRATIPAVHFEKKPLPERPHWMAVAEYGESHPEHTLNIDEPTNLAVRLLASMSNLDEGEEMMMQTVVSAPLMTRKPTEAPDRDTLEDQRSQLNELNFSAVIRIGTAAPTDKKAKELRQLFYTALRSTDTPHNRWRPRMVSRNSLDVRMKQGAPAFLPASRLKVSELSGVIGWAHVSGMPRGHARVIPVPNSVSSEGLVIGEHPANSRSKKVAIPYQISNDVTHTWIGGRTGVGKTVLLVNMAHQIMAAGHGLVLMEAEGDFYEKVLSHIPRDRLKDVIILDFADLSSLVGFNPLDQGNPDIVIDELIELFDHQFGNGLWTEEYIANGLRTLGMAKEPMSIIDLARLLAPRNDEEIAWGNEIVRDLPDTEMKDWWDTHKDRGSKAQQTRSDPALSRLNQFVVRPELRNVFGQQKSAFQMTDVLADNKILLVNLKGVSSKTVSLTGTLLINSLWHAAKTGASQTPTYLMLDEFKDFMDMPVSFDTLLSQARKRNLGLILANQHLTQLTKETQEGILTNARNKIVMQSRAEDARVILREMGSDLNERDIVNLEKYHALAEIETYSGKSGAFTVRTLDEVRSENLGYAAVSASRSRYGRPLSEVKQELLNRYKPKENHRRPRPKLSGDGFFEAIGKDD